MLPSLSRLMKDGIGEGYTRADHQSVANQLFSSYAKVGDARALASVIGEDELSDLDKQYLKFGRMFEKHFVGQGQEENRTIIQTLDIGWSLLQMLPREELDRIDTKILDEYYDAGEAMKAGLKRPDRTLVEERSRYHEYECISLQKEISCSPRTPSRWRNRVTS